MKLKVKLPILFSIIVLVLAGLMAIYIKASILGGVIMNVKEHRSERQGQEEVIQRQVEKLYPDLTPIEQYLEKVNREQGFAAELFDAGFHPLAASPSTDNTEDAGERQWYQIRDSEGGTVLLLSIRRPLRAEDIQLDTAFIKVFIFLFICLSIIFVGLTVYLHHQITKPIERLNNRLGGIKPSSITRRLTTARRDEIGELYAHVGEMEDRLQRSNKEQIDMIAAITHDFKTPLTSVNGFVELLLTKDALTEQDRRDYLRLIEKKSHHLTELVQQFSAFTQNEVILADIALHPVNFKRYFENTAVEYEEELSGLDIGFTWSHALHGGETFRAHEPMLRRVFANLIGNAVRYGAREGLHIYMSGKIQDGQAIIIVEDNGTGVPEEHLSSLFQKFFTVDSSRQIKAGGSGLGLASCKSIIERHGGFISAFPSSRGGLGICFILPLM
ncbi:HAMP domain-containing histidine kinase [Paenibacillus sp. 19GGS1-52]|uniref:sensor histidine kinase n=1 Tax=Paenibacillus sp. 19GGS1-52 TaxID=2758563 RepID=UPI001EFB05C7|nr:HAMP domain-containing sensor histidine kinase [Paenibacillus sp. 19GGS1-52]ULO06245.1 HAMP domain-containing histidine kinase [Paenibacillus sp. 19GGS1-52]